MGALQTLIMPVKCVMCGELFDLNYDLNEIKEENLEQGGYMSLLTKKRPPLCWVCRLRRKQFSIFHLSHPKIGQSQEF
jgi:hypothetical protein